MSVAAFSEWKKSSVNACIESGVNEQRERRCGSPCVSAYTQTTADGSDP
jgi:hypothetical protein